MTTLKRILILAGLLIIPLTGWFIYKDMTSVTVSPKTGFWYYSVIPTKVCHPEGTTKALKGSLLIPCRFSFFEATTCLCEMGIIPSGSVEIYYRPKMFGDEYTTKRLISYGKTTLPSGEVVDYGRIDGACIVMPQGDAVTMWAHGLGHACGYEHATLSGTSIHVKGHVMSHDAARRGESSEGMEKGATEADFL